MLWQKKKRKKKLSGPKPKVIAAVTQPAEEGPKPVKSDGKDETPRQKIPDEKKREKVSEPRNDFLKAFKQFTGRHHPRDIWSDFITMFACALSNPLDKGRRDEREALYLRLIKKYNDKEQALFPELAACTVMALEENPEQDFLGSIFMSLDLGNDHNGQFFTPYHVCELLAEVTMADVVKNVKNDGYISIDDPCCGAGATLIAGIHAARKRLEKEDLNYQNHILITAQDIDETVALMCYIQLSLLGVAGCVKVGNSLTDPITNNDNKDSYWYTPMYFSNVWTFRRIFGRC